MNEPIRWIVPEHLTLQGAVVIVKPGYVLIKNGIECGSGEIPVEPDDVLQIRKLAEPEEQP